MKRPSFTLIELILVITIIAIIVGFLVLDFRAAIQRQEMGVISDQALAMLQQSRAEVTSGKKTPGEDGVLECIGGQFQINSVPTAVRVPFDVERGLCDLDVLEEEVYGATSQKAVVEENEVGAAPLNILIVLFEPPNGNAVFYDQDFMRQSGDARILLQHKSNDKLKVELFVSAQNKQITLRKPDAETEE